MCRTGCYFTGQAPALASPARTELFQIVAAINHAGVEEGAWFSPTALTRLRHPLPLLRARGIGRARHSMRAGGGVTSQFGGQGTDRPTSRGSFRAGRFHGHAGSLGNRHRMKSVLRLPGSRRHGKLALRLLAGMMPLNSWGAQPPRLSFGAPSRRTQTHRNAPNGESEPSVKRGPRGRDPLRPGRARSPNQLHCSGLAAG